MFSTRLFSVFASHPRQSDATDSIPTECAVTPSGPRDLQAASALREPAAGPSPAYDETVPMGLMPR
jgi:hypothetical protein